MKKFARYIFSFIVILALLLGSLFIPYVTKSVAQGIVNHYVDENLSITKAHFTLKHLKLRAAFNSDAFIDVVGNYSFGGDYNVSAVIHSDIQQFSRLAGSTLPHLWVDADLIYDDTKRYRVHARLLKGTFDLNGSVTNDNFSFEALGLDFQNYLDQQPEPLHLVSGTLNLSGEGSYAKELSLSTSIQSSKLVLQKPLLKNMTDAIQTLPVEVNVHLTLDKAILNLELAIKTAIASLNTKTVQYNLKKNVYEVDVMVQNHTIKSIPLHQLSLRSEGSYLEDVLQSEVAIQSDMVDMILTKLIFHKKERRLSTLFNIDIKENPYIALQDNAHVEGSVKVNHAEVIAKVKLPQWKKSLALMFKDNALKFHSEAVPLASLQKFFKLAGYAKGDVGLKGDIHFDKDQPEFHIALESQNLELNATLKEKTQLKTPLYVKALCYSQGKHIVIKPSIQSPIANLLDSELLLYPKESRLDIDLKFTKVEHPYYQTDHLQAKGSLNYKKAPLLKLLVISDYERFDIRKLRITSDTMILDGDVTVRKLNRFAKLSESYVFKSKVHLFKKNKTELVLQTAHLGEHKIIITPKGAITLRSKDISLEHLQDILGEPRVVTAILSLNASYYKKRLKAYLSTPLLDSKSLGIQPIPLVVTLKLKEISSNYYGSLDIKTPNEKLAMVIDHLSSKPPYLKSDFTLDIENLKKLSYKVDLPTEASLHITNGYVELSDRSKFHAEVKPFILDNSLYKKLNAQSADDLELSLIVDANYYKDDVSLTASLTSDYLSLTPLKAHANVKTHLYQVQSNITTMEYPTNITLDVFGNYQKESLSKATVVTQYETFKARDIRYKNAQYRADFLVDLKETPKSYKYFHHKAKIDGSVRTNSLTTLYLSSKSFDGAMDVSLNEKDINIQLQNVSLVKLLNFSDLKAPIVSGVLDANISLKSDTTMLEEQANLNGDILIQAYDIEIVGINMDESINIVRNTQDISIFKGQIPGVSILARTLKSPLNLTGITQKHTNISKVYLKNSVVDGNVTCLDCALKTEDNRIAVKGNVLLDNNASFENLKVGLLLDNGCAYYIQKIEGNVAQPKVKKAMTSFHLITGTVGSVVDVVGDGVSALGSGVDHITGYIPGSKYLKAGVNDVTPDVVNETLHEECKPFYLGEVHPN